jgi:hypothetical protein
MQKQFVYDFKEWPLNSLEELLGDWDKWNCRRAVQYFVYDKKKIFLSSDQVLCPFAYNEVWMFIVNKWQYFSFSNLNCWDIIYAEKIKNKEWQKIDKGLETFDNEDDYVISLHTALFNWAPWKEIWHATSIEGSSCYWSLEKFLNFYNPIAAKRIV